MNLVLHLQVAAFSFYNDLHSEKKVSLLVFIRNLVHQYTRFDKKARLDVSEAKTISGDSNGHLLEAQNEGQCKNCMKSCPMIDIMSHTQFFALYRTVWYTIRNRSDMNYKTCTSWSYWLNLMLYYCLAIYIQTVTTHKTNVCTINFSFVVYF